MLGDAFPFRKLFFSSLMAVTMVTIGQKAKWDKLIWNSNWLLRVIALCASSLVYYIGKC